MSRVIIYTLANCPTSQKALAALQERGIDFEERRVDENPQWWEEALQYAVTVPIIVWGEGDVEVGWEGEHG